MEEAKPFSPMIISHEPAHLFSPFTIRNIHFKNRIVVSPMCQYSSINGFANEWHFVHLASRAVGGAALIFTEAAAVTEEGRISPQDLGFWSDEHIEPLARIIKFIESQNSMAGIQLAHAGRKGSTKKPWEGTGKVTIDQGGWQPVAPSPIAFAEDYFTPTELSINEIQQITISFAQAAQRAISVGFKVIEIHSAHGYLLHEFLSPLSNKRHDQYGGNFDNRIRLLIETVDAVRKVWPENLPLFVRISATDWSENGWNLEESIELSRRLKNSGVDLIDASSGGSITHAKIPLGPGYQTIFAEHIRHHANIATGAVGLITSPIQADHIIRTGQADFVFLAREMLRNPYWPLNAAMELKQSIEWPSQYLRAAPTIK